MGESGDREETSAGGEPQSATSEHSFTDPSKVERRVWRNIFAVIAVGVMLAIFFADLKFRLGLALGGALAIFNYKWMQGSLREVLETGNPKAATGAVMKFVLRWFVVGVLAYMAHGTGYFDPVAILLGLFAPAIAVIIEAGYVTYRTIVQDRKER
jgi:hypothetical protein